MECQEVNWLERVWEANIEPKVSWTELVDCITPSAMPFLL